VRRVNQPETLAKFYLLKLAEAEVFCWLWPVRAQAVNDLKKVAPPQCVQQRRHWRGRRNCQSKPQARMIENPRSTRHREIVRRSRFQKTVPACGIGNNSFRPRDVAEHLQMRRKLRAKEFGAFVKESCAVRRRGRSSPLFGERRRAAPRYALLLPRRPAAARVHNEIPVREAARRA